jgi:hypothetical protein
MLRAGIFLGIFSALILALAACSQDTPEVQPTILPLAAANLPPVVEARACNPRLDAPGEAYVELASTGAVVMVGGQSLERADPGWELVSGPPGSYVRWGDGDPGRVAAWACVYPDGIYRFRLTHIANGQRAEDTLEVVVRFPE